ncbi:hypothetical protein F4680DRAFT_419819 [Xylaria scruposa]|nr:hypothetical protein F4680DRAFT_419819 [Xylaria scruposa]
MVAPTSAASDSFPFISNSDPLHYTQFRQSSSLESIPRTLPQNQDNIEAKQPQRDKILNRFHAYLKPSVVQSVTEEQASAAVNLLVQECDSSNLNLDFDRIVRWAVWRSHFYGTRLVKYLVEQKKADLFQIDTEGRHAIFYCRNSHTLGYIISKAPHDSQRQYLNLRDKHGRTPLHYAARAADRDIVEHLLALDADADIKDNRGEKAIDFISSTFISETLSLRLLFAFKEIQNAQPHSSFYCKWGSIDLKHHLAKFQDNFQTQEIKYQQLESQHRKRDNIVWIALPWTNGILVHAAMRWLERNSGQKSIASWEFASDLHSSFITPGDPDLLYLEPSCSLQFKSALPLNRPISATIVFPCLVLRSKEWHRNTRTETEKVKLEITDGLSARFIHHERTLDETHYPSLSAHVLASRNETQVVSREWNRKQDKSKDGPILTVPQLWIWMVDGHIISAYPERDPENFETQLGPDFNLLSSAGIGIGFIIAEHISRFDKKQPDWEFLSPLDFFEAGVFQVLEDVQAYTDIKTVSRPDLKKEHDYMFRIADIREELAMIQTILSRQFDILDKLISDFECYNPESLSFLDRKGSTQIDDSITTHDGSLKHINVSLMANQWEKVKRSRNDITRYLKRVSKIDNDAERIEKGIQDQLNLKRTHASIRDAEASLLAARAGLIISAAVIGFTVITVIFAPLAFVTALFALPLDALLKNQVQLDGGGGDADDKQKASPAYTTNYVGKWFAVAEIVTLAVTILFVLLCLWIIDETAVRQTLGKITGPLWALPEQAITYYWNIIWWILYRSEAKKKLVEDTARQILEKITALPKQAYWNTVWWILYRAEAKKRSDVEQARTR